MKITSFTAMRYEKAIIRNKQMKQITLA